MDDGSTDGGGELVLSRYGEQVKLIHQANQGVSAARNAGIQYASFDYVAFLDADDFWHPDFLHWMHFVLEKYSEVGMVGSSYSNVVLPEKLFDPRISVLDDYFNQADYNTLFTSSSTVIHRSFFKNQEGFKTHLTKGEDIDVWLRAFDWFKKAYYIHVPLMFYDLNASGSLSSNPGLQKTIFPEMFRNDYAISKSYPSWLTFRDKYLTLNLFQYFDQEENFSIGKQLLKQRSNSYPVSQIPYLLPFSFFKFALPKPRLKKLIRNYLKFCFRYLYK